MKKNLVFLAIVVLVLTAGCCTNCKRACGQIVVDSTEIAQFQAKFRVAMSHAGERLADEVLKTSFAVPSLPSGTETITVQTVAYQRILDVSRTTSLFARLVYFVGRVEARREARIIQLTERDRRIYEAVANVVGNASEKAEAKRAVDFFNNR